MLTKCAHFSSLPENRTLPCFLFLFVHQPLLHVLLLPALPVAACSGISSCSGDLMRKIPLKTKRSVEAALLSRCPQPHTGHGHLLSFAESLGQDGDAVRLPGLPSPSSGLRVSFCTCKTKVTSRVTCKAVLRME